MISRCRPQWGICTCSMSADCLKIFIHRCAICAINLLPVPNLHQLKRKIQENIDKYSLIILFSWFIEFTYVIHVVFTKFKIWRTRNSNYLKIMTRVITMHTMSRARAQSLAQRPKLGTSSFFFSFPLFCKKCHCSGQQARLFVLQDCNIRPQSPFFLGSFSKL